MASTIDLDTVLRVTNADAIPQLLDEVAKLGNAYTLSGSASTEKRLELLAKAEELTHSLKTPREIMIQDNWSQPVKVSAISFGVTSGLWTAMASNGDKPQKVPELAKQIGVEEDLLRRMMRHIAASGYLNLTSEDEYTPNNFSKSMAVSVMGSGYHAHEHVLNPPLRANKGWFKKNGYIAPTNALNTPYQIANQTELHWFEHLRNNPKLGEDFNNIMFAYLLGRPAWSDIYPVQERLIEGFDSSDKENVLLVDLAGGLGHYATQFQSNFPDAPGRLVLQELPVVVDAIQELPSKVEKMPYDMFTENPIKGARAYFTHFVLHDWPDKEAVKIATRVKEAMKPGYSKFIIHEHVIPPTNQNHEQTALDHIMMTLFASKERSAAQWSDLLEKKVGLKIVKIYSGINGVESVVECERPE